MDNLSINLGEELERKTLEALARVVSDYETGAVSQPQARYGLQLIFTTTSGLVGNEAFDLVSQASAQINEQPTRDMVRRFFVHPTKGEMVLLSYQYGEAEVVIKRCKYPRKASDVNAWDRTSKATFETEVNPYEAAKDRFVGYAASLCRVGFQEIV